MKLSKHAIVKGRITCLTGLRIGGSQEGMEIGGMDQPIIRNPVTNLPYLPGSSLKGKMRSLLEWKYRAEVVGRDGKPCGCGECEICTLFGSSDVRTGREPTRLIFRDASLTPESESVLREVQAERGLGFSEVKSETAIDRRSGKALSGSLRTWERIPEGTSFQLELAVRIFEDDNEENFKRIVAEGLALMEKDYLGSSGSRGYGKIKFEDMQWDGEPFGPADEASE